MSKHTPGPWHAVEDWHTAVNSEKKHVAMINFWHSGDEQSIDEEEHQANARLIAASPDLLAACEAQQKLIDALEKMLISYRIGKQPTEKTFRIIDNKEEILMQARAAIAKVKGDTE